MKKVAIVGLGWLSMPLALSLSARGWQVTGSKTTRGRRGGGEDVRYRQLSVTPGAAAGLRCRSGCIDERGCAGDYAPGTPRPGPGDVLSAGGTGGSSIRRWLTISADRLHQFHFRIRQCQRDVKENSPRDPQTASGRVLKELEDWLHNLPGTSVDILRLAGLVGPLVIPGVSLPGSPRRTVSTA